MLLKEFDLNNNQDSMYFHSIREPVPAWCKKAKTYFHENELEIQDEKKLNRETWSLFKVMHQQYVI